MLLREQGYRVHVIHDPDAEVEIAASRYSVTRPVTKVWVSDASDLTEQTIAFGQAILNPGDTPNRRLGLTIAVGRAVKQLGDRFDPNPVSS